jgi:excisionase family DNA binding protein
MTKDDDTLTADEAAKILRSAPNTVRAEASKGKIPHRRMGRKYLFSRAALMEWMKCT